MWFGVHLQLIICLAMTMASIIQIKVVMTSVLDFIPCHGPECRTRRLGAPAGLFNASLEARVNVSRVEQLAALRQSFFNGGNRNQSSFNSQDDRPGGWVNDTVDGN